MNGKQFSIDYPQRCLTLLKLIEGAAKKEELDVTCSLMVAGPLLVVPWERHAQRHILEKDKDHIFEGVQRLVKGKFLDAEFWDGQPPGKWDYVQVDGNIDEVDSWVYKTTIEPEIAKVDTEKAFFIMRNAVAHGSIVTRADGPGKRIESIDFVSLARKHTMAEMRSALERRSRSEDGRLDGLTVDVITTTPEDFQRFLELWATWIIKLAGTQDADAAA